MTTRNPTTPVFAIVSRYLVWSFLALVSITIASCSSCNNQPKTFQNARAASDAWLLTDCKVGDENVDLSKILKANTLAFQPFFSTALISGPPAELLKSLDSISAMEFDYRTKTLAQDSLALGKIDVKSMKSETLARYQLVARLRLENQYKTQAMLGMEVVGADAAAKLEIVKLASDPTLVLYPQAKKTKAILHL
jgi:hypothetical protein